MLVGPKIFIARKKNKRINKILIISLIILFISSCHHFFAGHKIYGIRRIAKLNELESGGCIIKAIKLQPNIFIENNNVDSVFENVIWSSEKRYKLYNIGYATIQDTIRANLQIDFTENGIDFRHTSLYMHQPPKKNKLDKIREIMLDIEEELKNNCGPEIFATNIEEKQK